MIISLMLFPACQEAETHPSTGNAIVLLNGMIIDGTGAPAVYDAVVVVQDGLISDIGGIGEARIPADSARIDLSGKCILPGFINAHVHNAYNEFNLRAWAQSGVTTVRDLGGNPQNDLFAFRDSARDDPLCARLVAAGPMVTVPGGYPTVPWGSPGALPVTSPDDARDKITRLLDDGADVIKIALESGKSFNLNIPMLTLEEARAIVDVTHERGTVVSAHVLTSNDLEHALNAGVDDIAHMVWDSLGAGQIERVKREGIYWVPTLELWYAVNPSLGDAAVHNLSRFVQVGGQVALGTDFDGYDSQFDLGMPMREIRWMLTAGMTPLQIIVAATKNAAQVCNLGDRIGTLEIGKSADLFIVDGNPLEDVNVLLNTSMVINRGEIIYRRKKSSVPRR
jgi:imidazolonepropionase-like amidohydrolase